MLSMLRVQTQVNKRAKRVDPTVSVDVQNLGKRYRIGKVTQGSAQWWRRLKELFGKREAPKKIKSQREIWALRGVSFTLVRGTILGIIGPNGAGKSTLLKILARVTPPTEGMVRGNGRVVSLLEAGAALNAELTARENIFLHGALYGIDRHAIEEKMSKIIEFAGIEGSIDQPLKHYSSGMYLRFAFSVAINMEPDILLADEVLAVGDQEFQEKCLQRVSDAGGNGMTVLFVSHDMESITRLCNRAILLNAGQVVSYGNPDEVVATYESMAWQKKNNAVDTQIIFMQFHLVKPNRNLIQ
jgi:lipopolysaccharide transport system ATP-binding protein